MTGEVMYRMYWKFMKDLGCSVDPWEDLDAIDRSVWNRLAGWVEGTEA